MIIIEGLNHIDLTVSSLDRSIEFYKDLFDFEVIDKLSTTDMAFMKMADFIVCLHEVEGYQNQEDVKNRICFYVLAYRNDRNN